MTTKEQKERLRREIAELEATLAQMAMAHKWQEFHDADVLRGDKYGQLAILSGASLEGVK